ncbi:hypothetical protein [Shimia sp.]|uniref:hypothetical protein n=1 Tax=Shimia sp. TaxID=1954381 RepID=UPI003299AB61
MTDFPRIISVLAATCMLLSACSATSYSAFINPGTPVDRVSRDRAECDVESNRLFPAAVFTNSFPTGTYGGYRGHYPGFWGYGGSISQTDVNAGMRNQHRTQCMRLKGYEPYTFPVCSQEQLGGRAYAPLNRSPAPTPSICAVTLQGGGIALIDLSKPQ